jgi:putative Holliday junction resolvase
VGIAISDPLRLTAQPLEVVGAGEAVRRIMDLVEEHDVDIVVIGLPTRLGGGEGASAGGARDLGLEVATLTGVEVVFADERYTSKLAGEAMIRAGVKRQSRRESVDKVAAALILQSYLDSRARGNASPSPGVEDPDTQ